MSLKKTNGRKAFKWMCFCVSLFLLFIFITETVPISTTFILEYEYMRKDTTKVCKT